MAKPDNDKTALDIVDEPMDVSSLDLSAWLPAPGAAMAPPAAPATPVPGGPEALATVAIEVWRLKGRLGKLRERVPAKELRPLESGIGKMEEALGAASVQVDDPQGRPYHDGDPFEVLLFEPSPGLARPMVLQTVKPAVQILGKLARRAEVVVGTCVEGEAKEQDKPEKPELMEKPEKPEGA